MANSMLLCYPAGVWMRNALQDGLDNIYGTKTDVPQGGNGLGVCFAGLILSNNIL